MSHPLSVDEFVPGHDVLQLLAERGGRCSVEALREASASVFGAAAVYGNCHGDRFDFDGLLDFLSSRGKLRVEGEFAALGNVPACSGH